MRFKVSIFSFLLIYSLSLQAQGGFKRQFKLPYAFLNDSKAVFETTPNNYMAMGIVVDTLNGFTTNRLTFVGLNNQGQPQWVKKYGNAKFEHLNNVLISKWYVKEAGYLYYTGCVKDSNNKQLSVLLKVDFNGDTMWQKKYTDPSQDIICQMLTKSVDDGFLITGFAQSTGNNPLLLIKTDNNGNELWRKYISKTNPNVHDGKVIIQDSASKKIVTIGYQYYPGNSLRDNVVICDSLGNKISQQTYSGIYGGWLLDAIQTKDKKIVAVGKAIYPQTLGGTNLTKSFIVKFDINNPWPPIWKIDDVGPLVITNTFTRIHELDNEDLIVSGLQDTMQQHNLPTNNIQRLTRISKNGVVLWHKYYDYSPNHNVDNNMQILGFEKTSDKGFVAAIEVVNTNPNPFFIVKFDSTFCDSTPGYCSTVGLPETQIEPHDINIYPNPANDILNIELLNTNIINLSISNNLGQIILEEELNSIGNKTHIPVKSLPNGFYIISLKTKSNAIIKKQFVVIH